MSIPGDIISTTKPYHGIRSFEIDEQKLFFGREQSVSDLLSIISNKKFTAVTGASGSGKSSLIKAGLIPRIISSSTETDYIVFRPGNNPVGNLNSAVSHLITTGNNSQSAHPTLEIPEDFLLTGTIEELLKTSGFSRKLVIYVDQFEELFRYRQSDKSKTVGKTAEIFVRRIVEAAEHSANISVIISLRSDFLSDCTEFSGLAELINKGHYLIPQMTRSEKQQAVTGPAKAFGTNVDEELVKILLDESENYKNGLPILQHVLMKAWEIRTERNEIGSPLSTEHYIATGTMKNALSKHAEAIFQNLYSDKKKKIAEKLFKTLIFPGENGVVTRRPTPVNGIILITESSKEELIEVIDNFRAEGSNFLLPLPRYEITDETVIDIAHESLPALWTRLVDWVDEETKSAQLYTRLSKAAELYQEKKTGLLVNPDLELALQWISRQEPTEEWALRYDAGFDRTMNYIRFSKKEYDLIISRKESKREKDLKRARAVMLLLGSAAVISILMLLASLQLKFKADSGEKLAKEKEKIAVSESKKAEEKRREAVSHKRTAEQQQQIADQQKKIAEEQRAFAIKQQSEALYQKSIAVIAKNEALKARDLAQNLQNQAEDLRDKAIQQKQIAETERLRAELSEAKTDTLRRLAIGKSLAIQAITIYNNNKKQQNLTSEEQQLPFYLTLYARHFNQIYGGNPYDPDIFSALMLISDLNMEIKGVNTHSDAVRAIKTSPDGKFFFSAGDDGSVRRYSIENPEKKPDVFNSKGFGQKGFRCITLDSEGKNLFAGGADGSVIKWNLTENPVKPEQILKHEGVVYDILISETANILYSVGSDGVLRAKNLGDKTGSQILFKTNEKLTSVAFYNNNLSLICAGEKGFLYYIDAQTGSLHNKQDTENGKILTLNQTDDKLFIGFSSGKILVLNSLKNFTLLYEIFAHVSGINDIIFDADKQELATCSYDGSVKLWHLYDGEIESVSVPAGNSWVYSMDYAKNKTCIITGSADKTIRLITIDAEVMFGHIKQKVKGKMPDAYRKKYIGTDIKDNLY